MKTMISDFPRDLVEEILSRLPLRSMRRVRLTCRKWNDLLQSRSFTKMHISNQATSARKKGESMMIVLMDYNIYLMSVFVGVDPLIESKGKLSCLEEQVKISQVYLCQGLLLCILEKDYTRVLVWNPYLGQRRWITTTYRIPYGISYALGYEDKKSCRTYKILRVIYCDIYELYDFDSGLWKTLGVTAHLLVSLFRLNGVSLKGNTYFCTSDQNSEGYNNNYIICFDFTREGFGPLLHLPFSAGNDNSVALSCVREEKLAVLRAQNVNPYKIEIWITTKIEAEKVSWSKFFTWNKEPNFCISPHSFFIHEEKKVVMNKYKTFQIIGEAGYVKELCLGKRDDKMSRACVSSYRMNWPFISSYVPSLVHIK